MSLPAPASATLTEADIRLALRDCYDPDLPCNLVDLGTIDRITVTPDLDAPGSGISGVPVRHRVSILLTPVNPSDVAQGQLTAQILNRLAGLEAVAGTTVAFQHAPPWTPQRITPAGRRLLGLDGNPNLVQIR